MDRNVQSVWAHEGGLAEVNCAESVTVLEAALDAEVTLPSGRLTMIQKDFLGNA